MGRGSSEAAEAQRITERERDNLPSRVQSVEGFNTTKWRSEREWLAQLEGGAPMAAPLHALELHVDHRNIEALETKSCQQTVDELTHRVRATYAILPPREELAAYCGNRTGLKIYTSFEDLERKWFKQWKHRHAISVERDASHLY